MHSKDISGLDGRILLRKLVHLEHPAVLINFARNRKKCKHCSCPCAFPSLCFSPSMIIFSAKHVFVSNFEGQNYVLAHVLILFARLIFMPNQKDNSCLHFL